MMFSRIIQKLPNLGRALSFQVTRQSSSIPRIKPNLDIKVSGQNLKIADLITSDPYFTLIDKTGKSIYRSEVVTNTTNPTWKTFTLGTIDDFHLKESNKSTMKVLVKDSDKILEDVMVAQMNGRA